MQVTIRVLQGTARGLKARRTSKTASKGLLDAVKEFGLVLEPLHPGVKDRALSSYFTVEVPDAETAERVISRLNKCTSVEAAYIKPSDEPP